MGQRDTIADAVCPRTGEPVQVFGTFLDEQGLFLERNGDIGITPGLLGPGSPWVLVGTFIEGLTDDYFKNDLPQESSVLFTGDTLYLNDQDELVHGPLQFHAYPGNIDDMIKTLKFYII